jgi:hypothetical protein|eukprot:COSAG01_NODE_6930_length_3434_cov_57.929257_5_plen_48_part_00
MLRLVQPHVASRELHQLHSAFLEASMAVSWQVELSEAGRGGAEAPRH